MAVTAACQRFIDETLKPRFLPVIRPTQFNYPIDLHGKWRGTRYRSIQRYRSGFPETLNEEFDRIASTVMVEIRCGREVVIGRVR